MQRITREEIVLQVALLAAGLDTRAFRLDWPEGTTLLGLDQPDVLAYKEKILHAADAQPACTRQVIEMQAQSGAPWIGTMADPAVFLAQRGWEAWLTQAGAADAHYGRWPYPIIPTTMPNIPHNWFVTARKNPDHNFG